jgi:methyltransferase
MTWLLWALVAVVAVQRLAELVVNRRNRARLLDAGGRLVEDDGYRAIVLVHVAWFAGLLLEGGLAPWSGGWAGTLPLLAVAGAGEALRLWAIATLGRRWTTRVIVVPGEAPVREGPYRWLEHPNYVGVLVVLVALPAAFGLWATAGLVALAKPAALVRRVRRERAAWREGARASPDGA